MYKDNGIVFKALICNVKVGCDVYDF